MEIAGAVDRDGFVWVTGRAKELIKRGGHGIEPGMIENALAAHDSVAVAAALSGECRSIPTPPPTECHVSMNQFEFDEEQSRPRGKHTGRNILLTVLALLLVALLGGCHAAPDRTAPQLAALGVRPAGLERFAFYEAAARAYAVVRTTEARPYGCFILKKGVIPVG